MFRTALLIFSGSAGGAVLSLMRNLLIARLISVEDYGIAATFAMAMSVIEMLSTLGMQHQIVQSQKGSDPAFQASLQGFHFLRGVIGALVLFFAAGWIAAFLGIPEVAWAYQALAPIPLIKGLQHFDLHRLKRELRFKLDVLNNLVPSAAALAVAYPAFLWLGDYRVMLVAIGVQAGLSLAITHALSERRYRLRFDRAIMGDALRFGWPLLLNNILLFAVFNGEKLIVGRELGIELLGVLAMGFTLTLTPTLLMGRFTQNFFLPQLSALQEDREAFSRMAIVALQAVLVTILIYLAAMVLLGRPFIDWVLGPKYAELVPLLLWLTLLQALRVMKAGAAVVALARGQTSNALVANLVRLLVLPAIWVLAAAGQVGLVEIIWIAMAGEALGLLVALQMVRRRLRVSLRPLLWPMVATLLVMGILAVIAWRDGAQGASWSSVPDLLILAAAMAGACLTYKGLWTYIRKREMTRFESGATPL